MMKIKLLTLATLLALAPGMALAKNDHKNQLNTPIPEVARTSQQPLDARRAKNGVADPVEQHDQKPAQTVDSGNASPRPASK